MAAVYLHAKTLLTWYLYVKYLDMETTTFSGESRRMRYAQLGDRGPRVSRIRQTAPAAELQLSPDDRTQIESILRGDVAVDGPAPPAMPRS
jgi:hypothetical protein